MYILCFWEEPKNADDIKRKNHGEQIFFQKYNSVVDVCKIQIILAITLFF